MKQQKQVDENRGGSRNSGKHWEWNASKQVPINIEISEGDGAEEIRYIYRIINTRTGETYIGQHKTQFKDRIYLDSYFGSGALIKKAQNTERHNLKKEILVAGHFSKELIDMMEIIAIADERANGGSQYNISKGGSGGPYGGAGGDTSDFIDYKSDAFRNAIKMGIKKARAEGRRPKNKGWAYYNAKHGPWNKGKQGQYHHREGCHSGEKNSQFGKKQSEETKAKKRATRHKTSEELFDKIEKYLRSLNKEYFTEKECAEIAIVLGCCGKTVRRVWKKRILKLENWL